jgi:hypothetical protein
MNLINVHRHNNYGVLVSIDEHFLIDDNLVSSAFETSDGLKIFIDLVSIASILKVKVFTLFFSSLAKKYRSVLVVKFLHFLMHVFQKP